MVNFISGGLAGYAAPHPARLFGLCRRQMDFGESQWMIISFNKVVTPGAAEVPDVVLLLEQIHTSSGIRHAAPDRPKACCSIPVHKAHQKQFAFS